MALNHRFIIAATGNPILFDKTMIETSNLILYFILSFFKDHTTVKIHQWRFEMDQIRLIDLRTDQNFVTEF